MVPLPGLGQANGRWLARDERTLLGRDVDLVVEGAIRIHPEAGNVQLARGGSLEWDYPVLATGARLVPEQVPGLVEGAFEFYSLGACQMTMDLLGLPREDMIEGLDESAGATAMLLEAQDAITLFI